jgi:branched-chain amino acid aminotransferase
LRRDVPMMSTMADRDGVIWLDGEMVPWREAKTHVLTHTLHYGMGVFEGVRAYHAEQGTAIFRLQEHTDRLFRSAHILNMPMPFDRDTLNKAQKAAVRENNLDSAYIRPMCFYGSEGMGLRADNLKVHCMVAAWEWGAYLGAENMEKGIRIRVSSFTRHHVNITMCRAKANGNYMNSMLALQEALHDGYDEALLLDAEGYVMEGSGENIFIIREGVIYTPDLTSALDGITRKTVIKLAQEMGYQVVEKRITRDEVYIADEAFFTGTAAEVTPIREVDNRPIGKGTRGPITEKLQKTYFDLVHGRLDSHRDWLDLV